MMLADYLTAAKGKPWLWGEHDCCAFPAAWAGVILPYRTEAEAEALLVKHGSLVALWEAYGSHRITPLAGALQPGDVGVIEAVAPSGPPVQIGAIFTGRRWAFVPQSGGIAAVSADPIAAWRPTCLRR